MQPEPFGKYLLTERIAQGGMAEVFRAVYQGAAGVEKTVALKRILPALGGAGDFVTMFIDEARIAASLTHVNVAQVFEFGEVAGAYYLAMELVEGADLGRLAEAARRRRLPLPHPMVAFLVAEAARGLAYAHDKRASTGAPLGIVHRDVSPQNVLVSYAGEVKIADFGIAKAIGKLHKTESGAVMGKLRYMSPEQVTGEPLDGRSDLFSLGVVLHELLTGRTLFDGDNPGRVSEQVKSVEIRAPSASVPEVPLELDRICMKALERDRDARYQRASELARDLSRFVSERAPGLQREDVGALVAELAPPSEPAPPVEAAATTVELGGIEPRRTPILPMEAASSNPTERDRPPPAPSSPATPATPTTPAAHRSRTGRLLFALGIAAAVGIGDFVIHHRALEQAARARPDSLKDSKLSPVVDGGASPLDAALGDALPSATLPPLPPAPPGTRERLAMALSALPRADATRRGVPAEDYLAILSAVDGALCLPDAPEPSFPPAALARLQPLRIEPEARALARYLLATGELPPEVRGPFVAFLAHHPAYSPAEPGWAVAHLAALVEPDRPSHLVDLMRESSALGRWRAPADPPLRGPFAVLCDRQAVVSRYAGLAPGARAELLRRFLAATPIDAPLERDGLRYTVTAAARDEAAGKLAVELRVFNPGGAAAPLLLDRARLIGQNGALGPPAISPSSGELGSELPGGASRDLELTFTGAGDAACEAALLELAPTVDLQAYSELLR